MPTPKQSTMTILGTVKEMANEYETGAPLSNVNVELYTYEEPELPQLPPIGDKVVSTRTDEQGSYKFEIGLETLPQNCNELVVFVDCGYMGWMTVSVSPSPTQVDLAKGSIPLP